MSALYAGGFLFAVVCFVLWLGMRAARKQGELQAQQDALTEGAEKEREADEILAEPVPDRDAILERLRKQRPDA